MDIGLIIYRIKDNSQLSSEKFLPEMEINTVFHNFGCAENKELWIAEH